MLGTGEPCKKKAKYDLQRRYNEPRKEKPRKPQFSLNFPFNFGEEGEMRGLFDFATWRIYDGEPIFCRLFWIDTKEKIQDVNPPEMNSVVIQANSTESRLVIRCYNSRE